MPGHREVGRGSGARWLQAFTGKSSGRKDSVSESSCPEFSLEADSLQRTGAPCVLGEAALPKQDRGPRKEMKQSKSPPQPRAGRSQSPSRPHRWQLDVHPKPPGTHTKEPGFW